MRHAFAHAHTFWVLAALGHAQVAPSPQQLTADLIAALRRAESRLHAVHLEAVCALTDGDGKRAGDIRLELWRRAEPGGRARVRLCPETLPHAEGFFVEVEAVETFDGRSGIRYCIKQGREGGTLHSVRRANAYAKQPPTMPGNMIRAAWCASIFGALDADRVRLSDALEDAGSDCVVTSAGADRVRAAVVQSGTSWEWEFELRPSGPALRGAWRRVDGRVLVQTRVDSFHDAGAGVEYPRQCEFTYFDRSGTQTLRGQVEVLCVQANPKDLDDKLFTLDLPAGARVQDMVTGRSNIVGPAPGELAQAAEAQVRTVRAQLESIGAAKGGAASRTGAIAGAIAGSALLFFAVWRWRRLARAVAVLVAVALATRTAAAQWSTVWTAELPHVRLANCGLNACAFVAAWHGVPVDVAALESRLPLGPDWGRRLTLADIGRTLSILDGNLHVAAFERIAPSDLRRWLKDGSGSVVMHTRASEGHFLVAVGATDDAVLFVDPLAEGPSHAGRWMRLDDPLAESFWSHLSGAGLEITRRSAAGDKSSQPLPVLWPAPILEVDAGVFDAGLERVEVRVSALAGSAEPFTVEAASGRGCACLLAAAWTPAPDPERTGELLLTFDPNKWPPGDVDARAELVVRAGSSVRSLPVHVRGRRHREPAEQRCQVVPEVLDFGTVAPAGLATRRLSILVPAGKSIARIVGEGCVTVTCSGLDFVVADEGQVAMMRYAVEMRVPEVGNRPGRVLSRVLVDTSDGPLPVPVVAHLERD
ncbi:MAG: hypothetical protein R3F56_03070 [Planctomycetota bacterium]